MPWVKGQSGNVKGAPKRANSLARKIREATKDGAELVEFALKVMRDESAPLEARQEEKAWLADRGWGKAVEHIEIEESKPEQDPAAIATEFLAEGLGPEGMVQ